MLAIVLKSLASRSGMIGLAGALLASVLLVQTARLHHAKADLAQARRNNLDPVTGQSWRQEAITAMKSASELGAALDRQSKALLLLRAAQARATAASGRALAAAQILDMQDRQTAHDILQTRATGDPCAAANALIIDNLAKGARR